MGLPEPMIEYQFWEGRKWQFDFAWKTYRHLQPDILVALEVQGGIFTHGRHTRGAALVKEYEKLNHAAMTGWRVLFVQPKDLCVKSTVDMIKSALNKE